MATDFWASTHWKRWIVDRAALRRARQEDLQYVEDPSLLALLGIFFANLISKLGNKLSLRQRVIATATVFFRRFYLKNSYCATDPYIVLAACVYLAAKAEESPVHIKNVITEARNVFGEYGIKHFPTDNSKLAEMEFYLVDDLECDLTVFHPYRTLMALVKDPKDSKDVAEREAGELGVGIDNGTSHWGSGEGKLSLTVGGTQMAWFLINDTYRSDLCLLYPPHMVAIAALYLTCSVQSHSRRTHFEQQVATPQPRRSARQATHPSSHTSSKDATPSDSSTRQGVQDHIEFFANLNVNLPMVATIAQEIISFYALCDRLKDDSTTQIAPHTMQWNRAQTGSRAEESSKPIEVNAAFLIQLLQRMQMAKELDMAHPASGRPVAINKVLERAQAAG